VPNALRPSTFQCYDKRQQALIILGVLASCVTGLWGGLTLYRNYKIGDARLNRLEVDMTRVARPVRLLAKALLVDKCIKLHKLKDSITYSTLCKRLPFDEEQDYITDVIDGRILKRVAEIESHGKPLDLKHMTDTIHLSQVSNQQPDDFQAGGAQLRRRHNSTAAGGAHDGSLGTPTDSGTSSSIRQDLSHRPQAAAISQDSHDTAFLKSQSNLAAKPPNAPSSASQLNEVVIQPQHERSQPPPAGPGSSRPPASKHEDRDAAFELKVISTDEAPLLPSDDALGRCKR
jgi:hypothetical protein